jgi:ElaB/YqjD/DUF883 family membrane-anchored ribosome-binding protein
MDTVRNEGAGTAARMQESVNEKATEVKDIAADYGRKAVDTINAQRGPTASALDQTASTLHEKGDKAATVAHRTADKIQATADYIREHDLEAMADDVGSLVRRYPGQSLAAAAIAGFVLARLMRRND